MCESQHKAKHGVAIHSFEAIVATRQGKDCCKFCHKAPLDFYLAKRLSDFYLAANLNFSTPVQMRMQSHQWESEETFQLKDYILV